jgi:DNA replication protein DnaC
MLKGYKERLARLRREEAQVAPEASPTSRAKKPKRRIKILSKPKDFAPSKYICRKCKDIGFFEVLEKGKQLRLAECECRRTRIIEWAIREAEESKPRFKPFTLETYKPEDDSQRKALRLCKEFVKRWPLCEKGIMMCGPVGIGKTGLLWATARDCAHKTKTPPLWELAADLLSRIRHTYNSPDGAETEHQIINRFARAPLLLLDDLGVEKESEWSDGIFLRLLGDRHLRELPTLITTNWMERGLMLEGEYRNVPLKDRIGARLYSRLHESVAFIEMYGKDRRL